MEVSKHGISDATFYNWLAKYSGLEVTNWRGAMFHEYVTPMSNWAASATARKSEYAMYSYVDGNECVSYDE